MCERAAALFDTLPAIAACNDAFSLSALAARNCSCRERIDALCSLLFSRRVAISAIALLCNFISRSTSAVKVAIISLLFIFWSIQIYIPHQRYKIYFEFQNIYKNKHLIFEVLIRFAYSPQALFVEESLD